MRHYERLDTAIGDRRLSSGLSWADLASRIGVSESALRNIRRGRNEPSELTKHRLEQALRWAPGSIDAILDGGEPTPADEPAGSVGPELPVEEKLRRGEQARTLLIQALATKDRDEKDRLVSEALAMMYAAGFPGADEAAERLGKQVGKQGSGDGSERLTG